MVVVWTEGFAEVFSYQFSRGIERALVADLDGVYGVFAFLLGGVDFDAAFGAASSGGVFCPRAAKGF